MFGRNKKANKEVEEVVEKTKIEYLYKHVVDIENSIIIIRNYEEDSKNYFYKMIHTRLINNELVEINSWKLNNFTYIYTKDGLINDLNIFMVEGAKGFDALYDYKQGKFIVEKGIWDQISINNRAAGSSYQLPHVNYLEQYNCFLANFSIQTTYNDELISYENPITKEHICYDFELYEGPYFALLNIDGSIRGNKLFKGNSFSRITSIIDLNKYSSLDEFKQERIKLLEQRKKEKILEYNKRIASTDSINMYRVSPYMDEEVLKVLKLEK